MKREQWLLINTTNKNFVIGDLPRLPGFTRKSTVEALQYHTKNEIEQSIALKSMINNGWIKITKIRDNISESFTSDNALLAIESVEKNESSSGPAEPEDSSVTPAKLADTVIKRTNSNPTVNDDISLGYDIGSRWINTSTTPPTVFECLDNTAGAAVWREVIIANADGDIEGPILARESTGNDVPLDLEVVVRDNKLAIGDGSTIGGVKVATEEEVLNKLDLSFMCPPDGAVMVTRRSSGTFTIICQTSLGQYAVQWWDGTVTLHDTNIAATKAIPGSGAWSGSTLKPVIVYPATAGQNITSLSTGILAQDLIALNVRNLTSLTYLSCSKNNLTSLDLTGLANLETILCDQNNIENIYIQGLVQLREFRCSLNNLTNLDLRNLQNLETLYCSGNSLISLNVNDLTSLTTLICDNNNLTSLDLTGSINLELLSCSGNSLSSLDLTGLSSLLTLICNENNLTTLDLTDLINLTGLLCKDNDLNTLNLTGLTSLTSLTFGGNNYSSIDLSPLTNIQFLDCSNSNLTSLNLNNLTSIVNLIVTNNSNLTSIRATGISTEYGSSTTSPAEGFIIMNNNLNAAALNQFYTDLAPGGGFIHVDGNPGTTGDDPTIATNKGYTVLGT